MVRRRKVNHGICRVSAGHSDGIVRGPPPARLNAVVVLFEVMSPRHLAGASSLVPTAIHLNQGLEEVDAAQTSTLRAMSLLTH